MLHPRAVFPFLLLAGTFAHAQSVISTHSGVLYFFEGSVFIGNDRLQQKFGKFPEIGEGNELRTEFGRAEVLLTPGVFLRLSENSAIRMVSTKLSDARVELLQGSAILESKQAPADSRATVIFGRWQIRIPKQGVSRIDSEPKQLRVYSGETEVSAEGEPDIIAVRRGEILPFAAALVPEPAATSASDAFNDWALNRSEAVAEDNATAAGIIDDPDHMDSAGSLGPFGSYTYFPSTGIPSLGITNPYGLSFWSPFQPMLTSMYAPGFVYGPSFIYAPLYRSWPTGSSLYPRSGLYSGTGLINRPSTGGVLIPRTPMPAPRFGAPSAPHAPAPHPIIHR